MGKTLENNLAEQEANNIAYQFMDSNDVVKDMSSAYNTDFSNIRLHSDDAADEKVTAAGKDAIASGRDIFFGKGILESNSPESKGLLAHELVHTMQQGIVGSMGAITQNVSQGASQGGFLDDFRHVFVDKPEKTHEKYNDLREEINHDYREYKKANKKEVKKGEKKSKSSGGMENQFEDFLKDFNTMPEEEYKEHGRMTNKMTKKLEKSKKPYYHQKVGEDGKIHKNSLAIMAKYLEE